MYYLVVGLGNPGKEYEANRHNTGFILLDQIVGKEAVWEYSKNGKLEYFHSSDPSGKNEVEYIKPDTFMNRSGQSVAYAKTKHKKAHVIVVHDDVDLPLGSLKISHARGTGGHNGVHSIQRSLKSNDFIRIRIGVTPVTPTGKLRKPKGEDKVLKHLMGDFKKAERDELKKVGKKAAKILDEITSSKKEVKLSKGKVPEGLVSAMNKFN